MDINQHLDLLERNNRNLFGAVHTLYIVLVISAIAIILSFALPPVLAALLIGVSAFFILFFYVGYSIKKVNDRLTLLETKYKNQSAGL